MDQTNTSQEENGHIDDLVKRFDTELPEEKKYALMARIDNERTLWVNNKMREAEAKRAQAQTRSQKRS
ncbi:MAG: hypothetical protein AAF357_13565 [Verrucomicrobiota bacterium]